MRKFWRSRRNKTNWQQSGSKKKWRWLPPVETILFYQMNHLEIALTYKSNRNACARAEAQICFSFLSIENKEKLFYLLHLGKKTARLLKKSNVWATLSKLDIIFFIIIFMVTFCSVKPNAKPNALERILISMRLLLLSCVCIDEFFGKYLYGADRDRWSQFSFCRVICRMRRLKDYLAIFRAKLTFANNSFTKLIWSMISFISCFFFVSGEF